MRRKSNTHIILYIFLFMLIFTGCSTTKNLPAEEVLYTGINDITVQNEDLNAAGKRTLEEVEGAISVAPNNSFFGSPTMRIPFPLGLWIYNGFERYEKGIGKWIFKKFTQSICQR